MDIHELRSFIAERDSISILETVDVHTRFRSVLKAFDYVIEALNWTRDGRYLVYNSRGWMYKYETVKTTWRRAIIRPTRMLNCVWFLPTGKAPWP